jgi:formiminoglutamase
MKARSSDPNWYRASAWLRGEFNGVSAPRLGVLGVPLSLGSITSSHYEAGPDSIRGILQRLSTYDMDADLDLRSLAVVDYDDLEVDGSTPEEAFAPISLRVRRHLGEVEALVLLGGDNAITRPACNGVPPSLARCGLLTLNAHLDLRSLEDGLTNANTVRALLEDGMPGTNIWQIGLQGFANTADYARVARGAGITTVTSAQVRSRGGLSAVVGEALAQLSADVDAICVDVDLDILDRAFSPATPGSRPGGFAPWELREAVRRCGAHPKVRVMDLVEFDPSTDISSITAFSAGLCVLSFASGMLEREP